MTGPRTGPVADARPREVPYTFTHEVPEEFVRLPEPTASEGWREAMAKLMTDADAEQLAQASEQLRAQLPRLSGPDTTVLTAMCVGTEEVDGDERLSMGLLAVTVRPSDHRDRLLAAEGIYRAKEKSFFAHDGKLQELDFPLGKGVQGRQDMLLAAKLPCGPGVMSTSLRTMTLPVSAVPTTSAVPATSAETETSAETATPVAASEASVVPPDSAASPGSGGTGPAGAVTNPAAAGSAETAVPDAAGAGAGSPVRPAGAGSSARPSIAVAALQLIIPAPRDYCVYVTISTPSVFLLDSYSARLAHIGRTFSFT
ncbi:RodZ family helix-turn-helix domain-containing protein [Streptomyces lycii]|uniref:hypothetical protein n=1 Tax=Streptomyces lycii TaxID=2654337 RepID=UPI001F253CA4|nr:hypothetical protein [Streptomyces lycii]